MFTGWILYHREGLCSLGNAIKITRLGCWKMPCLFQMFMSWRRKWETRLTFHVYHPQSSDDIFCSVDQFEQFILTNCPFDRLFLGFRVVPNHCINCRSSWHRALVGIRTGTCPKSVFETVDCAMTRWRRTNCTMFPWVRTASHFSRLSHASPFIILFDELIYSSRF